MLKRRMKRFLATSCSALALVCAAHSVVLYSSFGPGDTFQPLWGWTACGSLTSLGAIVTGFQFVSAASGDVGRIDVALSHSTGSYGFSLDLYDDASNLPNNLLGTWTGTAVIELGTWPGFASINVPAGTPLAAGGTYWLIARADPTSDLAWNPNSIGLTGILKQNANYFPNSDVGAFRLETVPEPASVALLGIGLGALLARRRKG